MRRLGPRFVLPVVLLLVTALAAYIGFRADRNANEQRGNAAAVRSVAAVQALTDGLGHRVEDVAGLFEASSGVDAKEFGIFAGPVLRTSEASTIGWAQSVEAKDRAKFERDHKFKIMTIDASGARSVARSKDNYVVLTYALRRDRQKAKLGLDLDSTAERKRALTAAAAIGNPVATPPIRFSDGYLGISLYMPVYGLTGGATASGLAGYTIGSFRFDDLASTLNERLAGTAGVDLSYRGKSLVGIGPREDGADIVKRDLDIAGQTWVVSSWVPAGGVGLGWLLLVGGLILTVLVTMLTNLILRTARHQRELAEARAREQELMLSMQERKSAAAEERFGHVFDSATIGMALMGTDGIYTKVNDAFCKLVRRSESGLIGLSPKDITHPDDIDAAEHSIKEMVSGSTIEFEDDKRYIDGNGDIVWVALRAKALLDEDGKTDMILIQVLDISERRLLQDRLTHMADHDALTGLPNRRSFDERLGQHLSLARRYGPEGALLVIDLDNFKGVNDLHGHHEGDVMLRNVAAVIRREIRDTDVPGRLGGDEFGVLLPKGGIEDVEVVAARLVKAISEMGDENSHGGVSNLTCSIGAALLQAESQSAESIFDAADVAMYEAKTAGGNRFSVSSGGHARFTA